ncbi:dolichyl-phosphate-mannose--protein mannosyltransferase [Microbacterium suaedae]|uniref:dolichyl-phosphate-mannose--protein mannosyltransferase n=1 Tax=Microbacterium suaedae TaxID=2067813 RepID=UPI000DA242A8|nr:glycosyltransferase family 39 protein [Microbacterium suaedae]
MTARSTTSAALRWGVPLTITALAAVLRIAGVGGPSELIFDETYYVKDAWTLGNLGYEGTWGEDPNPAFEAGDTDGFTEEGSFVAHPPLGKWIIALGMALFGPGPTGWRITTAIVGTLLVPLLYIVAKRLTGSAGLAAAGAALLAIDPLAVSMSRIALLDTHLAFLVLLAFWFALLDRPGAVAAIRKGVERDGIAGPVLWRRPWILAAGATLGLATAVKWSGLYAIAVLGIALVVADAIDRRRAGATRWVESAIGYQGPASFVLLVPPALVTYLISWTGWLTTTGGYGRGSSPNPLVALWNYHRAVFGFHQGVTSDHTYASPALEWIPMLNPTLMYRTTDEAGGVGLMAALPNPVVWWGGLLAVAFLAVRLAIAVVRRRRVAGPEAFVVMGILATYAPWLLLPSRTMFTFYAITMLPFVILALLVAVQRIRAPRDPAPLPDPTLEEIRAEQERQAASSEARRAATNVILLGFGAVGLFFLPFGTGWVEPEILYRAHLWLPTWFL